MAQAPLSDELAQQAADAFKAAGNKAAAARLLGVAPGTYDKRYNIAADRGMLKADDAAILEAAAAGGIDDPRNLAPLLEDRQGRERQRLFAVHQKSTPFEIKVAVSDESTAIATGTAKITWYAPMDATITEVFFGLSAQSSSGAVTIDLNKNGPPCFRPIHRRLRTPTPTWRAAAPPASLGPQRGPRRTR
ncbi:hypothetical protein [Mesorhizobium sp. B2-3-5]|uniref:hypothetical protein n=1 Tax=Mesorhizobium sp. B2-3-5 TaxID=2589958 RepID=UPI00112E19DE|nr:hypothetical protein [Mesorhizobium sp. B2-3-5]TPM35854.1 hypothetical protein FJ958_03430 [Mesorhizobium sp. B2-3-5]